jgi:hypothetical protein
MGYGFRYFIAEDNGVLTRVPAVTGHRWLAEAVPAERAARELKLLEVLVEVERRRVVDVLRILPVRHQADENGHLDLGAAMRRAQKRVADGPAARGARHGAVRPATGSGAREAAGRGIQTGRCGARGVTVGTPSISCSPHSRGSSGSSWASPAHVGAPLIISRPSSAGRPARGAHRRACCKALDMAHAAVL